MKCPACENQLELRTIEDLTVDVCKNGCGGIWFDNLELKQVDEKHESAGESLLLIEKNPDIKVDHSLTRICPICDGQKMLKHFMSTKHEVEVDECPRCGGYWLDAGELGHIRNQFETEADRKQAASKYFSDVFSDDLAKMRAESEEKSRKARNIAKMFRFLCPSYYIPGKQDWGAY